MWRQVWDSVRKLLSLAQKWERSQEEIEELRQQVKDLTAISQKLYYEVQRLDTKIDHQHENALLKLDNDLLRFERRLPPGKEEK